MGLVAKSSICSTGIQWVMLVSALRISACGGLTRVRTGRRHKLNCEAVTAEMSADPMVSSGAGMALHSCPGFLRQGPLLPFIGQDSDATLSGAVMNSQQPVLLDAGRRALILKRSPARRVWVVPCRIFYGCPLRIRLQALEVLC